MKFAYGLPLIFLGASSLMVSHQVASALQPPEVNGIAQKITVRISGSESGTGVIVNKKGNIYTVITNWHVVDTPGAYSIQTQNGRSYQIKSSQFKRLPRVDLALFKFQSNQNYTSANIANSEQITEGTTVHAAGWITADGGCLEQRCYNFSTGNIIGIRNRAKDGYGWQYSNEIGSGMSGGPVLDNRGRLVGINGRAIKNPINGRTQFFAIPINTYVKLAPKIGFQVSPTSPSKPSPPIASIPTPTSAQAFLDRGFKRFESGDERGAIKDFQQAYKINPDAAQKEGLVLAREAAQLTQSKKYDLALPKARVATQLAPNSDKVWFLLGGLFLQKKDFDNAISSLQKAQSLNPRNAEVLFALGRVYFHQKSYRTAVQYYQAGLKVKPYNNAAGLFDLGNAYYMLGRSQDAIAQYNKAISQNRNFWPAFVNIGLVKYEGGDIDGARRQWQYAIAADDQAPEPLLALAVALYAQGDRQLGIAMGKKAISIDKRYANTDFLKQNLWGERLLTDTRKLLGKL